MTYQQRLQQLERQLQGLPGAVVAFSGGVDSAMLLFACHLHLGHRVLAVTAESPSLPAAELAEAKSFCASYGIEHRILQTDELSREAYRANGTDRCYHCKTELFDVLGQVVSQAEEWPVLFGAIADDASDHRPGARAAKEHGVLAPLAEANLSKEDVRRFSREHGLATAEKPSFACLASRVPYGTSIDGALLHQLEQAENVLRELGYRQFRVRHHGPVARLELEPDDLIRAVQRDRAAIVGGIQAAGYTYVSLDLVGYRSGSLNSLLEDIDHASSPPTVRSADHLADRLADRL